MRAWRRVTPGPWRPRAPRTESATENILPAACGCAVSLPVRVKRWGKSPPRRRQRRRHGKPRQEQSRAAGGRPVQEWNSSLRVGCKSRPVTAGPDRWCAPVGAVTSTVQNPAYRPASFVLGTHGVQFGRTVTSRQGRSVTRKTMNSKLRHRPLTGTVRVSRHGHTVTRKTMKIDAQRSPRRPALSGQLVRSHRDREDHELEAQASAADRHCSGQSARSHRDMEKARNRYSGILCRPTFPSQD